MCDGPQMGGDQPQTSQDDLVEGGDPVGGKISLSVLVFYNFLYLAQFLMNDGEIFNLYLMTNPNKHSIRQGSA